jgi:MFS transporter, OFA family, oxalate/formate antiporter
MTDAVPSRQSSSATRWLQLVVGIVCMAMIANLQYGWTLFVNPMDEKHHWGKAAIQVAFSIFVLTETWLVPVEGWFVDHYGPRVVVAVGGILVAIAWTLDSFANSLAVLYLAAIISGIGAGSVYGTCVGNALKWFPDRRGLAAGLTAAGLGAGAALSVVPIRIVIGRETTMAIVFTLGAVTYWALGNFKNYTGNWHAVFVVSAIMNIIVVFAALFILKPMREAHHSENAQMDAVISSA